MKLRIPFYYKEFACIADKCKDSCCIGWEIDIDEDTFDYYKSVEGNFGRRLKSHMVSEDMNSFVLEKNGWCPFLNEKKLCDICIELGEEALSEVCTEYPRFTVSYGNVMEKALSLSCEEAGRIIFSQEEVVQFEEIEMPDIYEEEDWEEEISEELQLFRSHLVADRDHAIAILQNRKKSIQERIKEFLIYCENVQEIREEAEADNCTEYEYFVQRMEALEELEVLNSEWTNQKKKLKTFFTESNYAPSLQEYLKSLDYRELEQEQLLVYFTFRYFMKAWYDGNLLSKAQFVVASYLAIRDMNVVRFFENEKHFTTEDQIDTARIYSKEVEHSEDNLEMLEEDFSFDSVFHIKNLLQQI